MVVLKDYRRDEECIDFEVCGIERIKAFLGERYSACKDISDIEDMLEDEEQDTTDYYVKWVDDYNDEVRRWIDWLSDEAKALPEADLIKKIDEADAWDKPDILSGLYYLAKEHDLPLYDDYGEERMAEDILEELKAIVAKEV